MEITLAVIAGPYTGQTFSFNRPERFLVGRSPKAHFRLHLKKSKDLRVSRLHFLIEINPPLCRLHDLGSRNKTFVNGECVTGCDLKHGDEIRAGQTVLRVAILEEPTEAETTPWMGPAEADPKPGPLPSPPPVRSAPAPADKRCLCCSQALAESGSPLCTACRQQVREQPQPVPGYLLLRLLGRGGMGTVSLALRHHDQQVVALKMILPAGVPRPGQIDRFLREANILRDLNHSLIVRFHEMGQADGLIWFAMDYIPGTDAAQLLKQRGRLAVRPAVRLGMQLLLALEYAHERKFVHRDIKPGNILVETTEKHPRVKVADFGLARIYQASQLSGLTLQNEMGGTLEFMPPEQITHFRDVLPTADQFSAAATLYTLLTGKFIRDLSGPLANKVDQVLSQEPVPIRERQPDLPEELAQVIHRALESEPDQRFPNVTEFRRALKAFGT
jgi:serine/threonine-protein kinase